MNYNHGQSFTYVYGINKLDLLEQRYKTFSWMLGVDNVSYEASTNLVTAPDDVWKYMIKVYIILCKTFSFNILYIILKIIAFMNCKLFLYPL